MKEITKLKKEYEKVCEKLEQLNAEAFELEKEMMITGGREWNVNVKVALNWI